MTAYSTLGKTNIRDVQQRMLEDCCFHIKLLHGWDLTFIKSVSDYFNTDAGFLSVTQDRHLERIWEKVNQLKQKM